MDSVKIREALTEHVCEHCKKLILEKEMYALVIEKTEDDKSRKRRFCLSCMGGLPYHVS